jgi:transketolase
MRQSGAAGAAHQAEWEALFVRYAHVYPDLAEALRGALRGDLPKGWERGLPTFAPDKPMATRAASGAVLNAIVPSLSMLIGGSADLTGSNNTQTKDEKSLTRDDFSGRYIHFGVREHGMGGILNGIALHGGARPYGGTFLIFSDYMRPAIRLAALMELPVIFVFTHDSIGLGEDGPTHQPIEHLTSLRAIPNVAVFRPADAAETAVGWRVALGRKHGPTALVLTRQTVPVIDRTRYASAAGATLGAYVLSDVPDPQVILIATGSEVHIALEAQQLLAAQNIRARIVSMLCWELFEAQPTAYRESVLPPRLRERVAVEAGATLAWGRYVGLDGAVVGLDRFGASAPYQAIYRELGLTAEAVVAAARRVVADCKLEISHKKL